MDQFSSSTIGIVIPAHNEEDLLGRCLHSIDIAASRIAQPVDIVVVLDRCADGSARLVAGLADDRIRLINSARPGVGAARAAGFIDLVARHGPAARWLATTDADSEVPPHWLVRQLQYGGRGADMVVGTVEVKDWSERPGLVRERYLARYRQRDGHRHMHGANLSFRASAYLEVGGFRETPTAEDVDLIQRFEQCRRRLVWAADLAVTTSARRVARAPLGFANHLDELSEVR